MQRIPTTMLRMNAPLLKLIEKFEGKGLITRVMTKENQIIIPQPMLSLVNLPIKDIMIRYRMILNGLLNYYSFVNNRPRLLKIY
jgi:hypothetical protein